MAAMEHGDLEGCLATNIVSPFRESVFRQRAERPRKYEGSCADKCFYTSSKLIIIPNSHTTQKLFNTSFTSTLLSTLLSSLSLDAIFSFSCVNYRNYSIRYHYIINLNGFVNNKQYQRTAPLTNTKHKNYQLANTINT